MSSKKISSGYLTPQASRRRKSIATSFNCDKRNETAFLAMGQFDEEKFRKLLSCPIKRQLVLDLITSEKSNIEKYKQKLFRKESSPVDIESPLRNAQRKQLCDSPTMLFRKRALEQLNTKLVNNSTDGDVVNSSASEVSSSSNLPPTVLFSELLEGVIAYIEFRSDEKKRIYAVKMLMISMGAKVRDTFTRDVTHVVFKDGSFLTFQKAKLLKVHLVSVLWIEAVRTTGTRVSEKKFPALGSNVNDHNVSAVCSQMQKEYEGIIREELHRSIMTGTPMPSKEAIIDKRRTVSSLRLHSHSEEDKEVASIMSARKSLFASNTSPQLTISDDDSDSAPLIDGDIICKSKTRNLLIDDIDTNKVSEEKQCDIIFGTSSMELTNIDSFKENSRNSIYNKKTPDLKSNHHNSINESPIPDSSLYRRKTETFSHDDDNLSLQILKNRKSLNILSSNKCLASPKFNNQEDSSSMSTLKLSLNASKNDTQKSSGTSMSALAISTDSNKEQVVNDKKIVIEEDLLVRTNNITTRKRKSILKGMQDMNLNEKHGQAFANVIDESAQSEEREKKENENKNTRKSRKTSVNRVKDTPIKRSSSDTQSASDESASKRRRKLYDPTSPLNEIPTNDENERELRRRENKKMQSKSKSDDEVFAAPSIFHITRNIMLTKKVKDHIDKNKMDIKSILVESNVEPVKKKSSKRTQRNKQKNEFSIDDEQKQLKAEILKKSSTKTASSDDSSPNKKVVDKISTKITNRRRSTRILKNKNNTNKSNFNASTCSSSSEDAPIINRRSTMEFQSKSMMMSSSRRKLKIDVIKSPTIVCTKLHREDIAIFKRIVQKLGGFVVEETVSTKTTHLVAGEPKRTINMLRAIAMGCWILKHEWLLKSLEAGRWLPEEDYEEVDFSPVVQNSRLQRQAFGPKYTMDILKDCGLIYVTKDTVPKCSDLIELIKLCKGRVTTIKRNAAIVIGGYHKQESTICVKEAWLLDSMMRNRKLPFKSYILTT